MAKQKKTKNTHQLRIIGGQWRGQKITVIDQDDLRPTTDRVRETVFNWLASSIVNAHCLDAFAGSGVLSFEALSREAKSVVTVEKSRQARLAIEKNIRHLKAKNIQLIEQDALVYLKETLLKFDVIFLDPPFSSPHLLLSALEIIAQRQLLEIKGMVYIEMSKTNLHMLDSLKIEISWLKKKMAGQVCYALLNIHY